MEPVQVFHKLNVINRAQQKEDRLLQVQVQVIPQDVIGSLGIASTSILFPRPRSCVTWRDDVCVNQVSST